MNDCKQMSMPVIATAIGMFAMAGAAADSATGARSSSLVTSAETPPSAAAIEQRNLSQVQSDKAIDKHAVAALMEAQTAVKNLADGKGDLALAAIERATGKITVLTARQPSAALIPVKTEVTIVDMAPRDHELVNAISAAADSAMSSADYPRARVLLDQLASEIHVKIYNLPLATYPAAMRAAARLIDEKKNKEARQTLLTALNTLVVTDQLLPLPLIEAQTTLKEAQSKREQDKAAARVLLTSAQADIDRAKQLGYANKDPEYASLTKSISELQTQVAGPENTSSSFATLRAKMAAFFDRIARSGSTSSTPTD